MVDSVSGNAVPTGGTPSEEPVLNLSDLIGGEEDGGGEEPYTPEELAETDPEEIDPDRVPPALQPAYKAMQKGYEKKIRSLTRQVEDDLLMGRNNQTQPQVREPQTIEEAYDGDPETVLNGIKYEIDKEIANDPSSPTIVKLQTLMNSLVQRGINNIKNTRASDSIVSEVQQMVSSIPAERLPVLTEFAQSAGLSLQEIDYITNPRMTGRFAGKLVLAINNMYEKAMGKPTGKPRPNVPRTLVPGGGHQTPTVKKSLKDVSDTDFENLIAQAKNGAIKV
jgi:hypothetical protein